VTVVGRSDAIVSSPASTRVTIAGPPELVGRIRPAQIRAVADLSGLDPRPEPYGVPVRIDFVDLSLADLARITVRSLGRSKIEVRFPDRRSP
jgi:hypothetical protein